MAFGYDLVILGGGTGGYVAAIRASQLGLKTAIVEKEKLGGTCLHKGCIPSKALLRSAEVLVTAKRGEAFGIVAGEIAFNFSMVQRRKNIIIEQLHKGVQHLLKQGKIDIYEGTGKFIDEVGDSAVPGAILVEKNKCKENVVLIGKNVLIATGSRPNIIPGLELDGNYVISSNEALELETLPASIIIVGGGAIGIEWASMLSDFGVDVTVVEYCDRIVPTEDLEISKEMQRLLKKRGIKFITNAKVLPETLVINKGVTISIEVKGERSEIEAEKLLVSVGRKANIEGIGLENTDIQVDKGCIEINEFFQTKESHIYAIGDVIGGLQLAHVASHEGIIAVEHLAGNDPSPLDYNQISRCIYSNPEVASVGITEAQAIEMGYQVKVGKFPFRAIGKALVYGESDGFVKIVTDEKSNSLLGVHMIGPHVTDMISEAGLAMVLNAAPWDIGHTIHPHPTLSEAIGEAALAVDGKAIHF